jgi:hypothetical protein
MRSEVVGSSGEGPSVNKAVGGFSIFLATRISHSICASQVSSYIVGLIFNIFVSLLGLLNNVKQFSLRYVLELEFKKVQSTSVRCFFFNLTSKLALESRLRTHHSCKSVRFKQLIRDPLSV